MEERALLFLRATEGKEDFTNDEYMGARGKILDAMAGHIAARSEPEQTGESATTPSPTLPEDLLERLHSALQNREEASARMPMHFEEPESVFAANLERSESAKKVVTSMARPMSSVGVGHQTYNLDEDTRDRLLAQGRQDAAHAVRNTSSLLNDVLLLKSQVRRLTIMGILALVLLTLVLVVVSLRR